MLKRAYKNNVKKQLSTSVHHRPHERTQADIPDTSRFQRQKWEIILPILSLHRKILATTKSEILCYNSYSKSKG